MDTFLLCKKTEQSSVPTLLAFYFAKQNKIKLNDIKNKRILIFYMENTNLIKTEKTEEKITTTQQSIVNPKNPQQDSLPKDSQLELPKDPSVLTTCIKNIFAGLNKANKNGAFDIQEAHQLWTDLGILSNVVEQINKKVYVGSLKSA